MDDFEAALAELIGRFGTRLTDNQIITGLERALDEALVVAGDAEASKVRANLIDCAHTFRDYAHDMISGALCGRDGQSYEAIGGEDLSRVESALKAAGVKL